MWMRVWRMSSWPECRPVDVQMRVSPKPVASLSRHNRWMADAGLSTAVLRVRRSYKAAGANHPVPDLPIAIMRQPASAATFFVMVIGLKRRGVRTWMM